VSILFRHVSSSLAKNMAGVLVAVVAVYLAVDFFEKIDDFMEAGLGLDRAMTFFVLKLPFVAAQVAPVGVLLAALIVYGLMARHHEITAYLCGGADPARLFRPLWVLGLAATAVLMLFSETVVPAASQKADRIWLGEVRKEAVQTGRERNLWYRGEGFIARILLFVPEENRAAGLTLYWFDRDWKLVKRLDADRAVFEGTGWRMDRALVQDLSGPNPGMEEVESLLLTLPFGAADLKRVVRQSGEMTWRELSAYADKVEAEGYDAARFRVDLAARLSFPFVCLVMAFLGGSLALRSKRGEHLAWIMVLAVALAFGYWVIHSLALSLGYAGILAPVIAAWTANALYAALTTALAAGFKG